jgi:hypothetical protein
MGSSWCSLDCGDLWESEVGSDELGGGISSDLAVWHDGGLDDMDGFTSGGMSSSQFVVQKSNGVAESVGSVFFVHVDQTSSGFVLEHNTVVLD